MAAPKKIHPAIYIAVWIAFSSSVILYNKWILSSKNFHYPIFLTTWHLVFATILTQIMKRHTNMLPAAKKSTMTWDKYTRTVVPIGIFFSGSLIFNNKAYLHLSVAFIQMLKAATPIVVLVLSFMSGLKEPNLRLFLNVLIVVVGVAIASYGELEFRLTGFIYQVTGLLFESARLVLVQKLMTEKMDPLSSLYYFAPVCAFFNSIAFLLYEYPTISSADIADLGLFVLLSNASIAFGLNVAVVFLIGCTSSLVLTLSGVLKDILLICFSMIVFHSRTSATQIFGYSIALVALVKYKTMNMDVRKEYLRLVGKKGSIELPR
ncbi:triose-phosphate transporter family-domain-containing protein [Paraphysoderma sedebokerense]|nr:triose-phosphate transporter family-domain-containing protein [Paraphysoderma sedebokerense]